MMSHPYADELSAGLAAVRKAAEICQSVQAGINPNKLSKSDSSPVTIADFASQAVVCKILHEQFADDPIIAEEDALALYQPENAGFLGEIQSVIQPHYPDSSIDQIRDWIDQGGSANHSSRFWTLDPIDGTKGFLRRSQYAVSLALLVEGQIKVGILACPNLASQLSSGFSLFYAVQGHGAFAGQLGLNPEFKPIHVSPMADPAKARFCESYESGHSSHSESSSVIEQLKNCSEPIRMDSQAKYAMVASGEAEAYMRLPTKTGYFEKIWDHAGGVLIVQEAGGLVTDINGRPLDFCQGRELRKNRGVLVTNGLFHDTILGILQASLSEKNE